MLINFDIKVVSLNRLRCIHERHNHSASGASVRRQTRQNYCHSIAGGIYRGCDRPTDGGKGNEVTPIRYWSGLGNKASVRVRFFGYV